MFIDRDKRRLFEAVFAAEETRLLELLAAAVAPDTSARDQLAQGCRAFLEACSDPVLRELVIVQAPEALGWARWKELEEHYFLAVVQQLVTQIAGAEAAPLISRLVLAILDEAVLVLASAADVGAASARTVAAVLAVVDAGS